MFIFTIWILASLNSILMTIPVSKMSFCNSNIIQHFFCEANTLTQMSCAGKDIFYIIVYFELIFFGLCPFLCSLTSYIMYKPPNITETMESLLLKQIDEAATHNEVLVMGDFNYPDINWETETCETHKGNRFLLITKKNYLSQLVQNPTRGAALLDLILSNRPDRITNLQVVGHLGNSDHNIVQFHLSFTRGSCQGVTKTLNFRKAKFEQLRDALNLVDWDNILRNKNTDNKWEMFKNILNRQCKRFIPCGNKRTRNRKNPMWLNKEVRQAINSKKKAFALLKQDGTIEALKNYREKNTLSKKLIKPAKKETEKHIAKESKTNPKLFFNYINSKRIKTENVGPLKNSEERMVVDDEEKANILNTFFSTVFTVENEMLGEIPRNNENPILRVTNLTQEEVRNRLNKIKIDKSPGPDGIHPRVLRELSNVIDKPLFLIFSDCIATGSVPQDWRIANVVPIFKKGSKSEPGNYRPAELDGQMSFFGLTNYVTMLLCYIKIINVILKIKSRDGKRKAFSTCSSHLAVIILYYATGASMYMIPPSKYSHAMEQIATILCTAVTPILNPLIYSLRNKDVMKGLRKFGGAKLRIIGNEI
ncbi:unnamed protein product [Ranitomeya imitator]|uniref:Endonuclease/exonuclease/phosphatase domain-containing protein n=1 Tax=Ranitomeya imitator TaxID=111125 RepID=A0ABN9LI56_9NEOB|nr:unnamed protein product [Ranitomeya imitator]